MDKTMAWLLIVFATLILISILLTAANIIWGLILLITFSFVGSLIGIAYGIQVLQN